MAYSWLLYAGLGSQVSYLGLYIGCSTSSTTTVYTMGYASLVFYVSGTRTSPGERPQSLSHETPGEYSKVKYAVRYRGWYPWLRPTDLNGNIYLLLATCQSVGNC